MGRIAKATALVVLPALTGVVLGCVATALAAGGGEGHGNPWLDILYKTVNLVVLIGLLVYYLRKPTSAFLRNTAARVKQTLDDTRREAAETERRLEQQKKNIASLREELISLQEEVRQEAEAEKRRLKAEAIALAERFHEQTRLQLEQARNHALGSIRRELAEEAVRLAEEMIRERMDDERQRRLVNEHIERLEARP